MVRVGPEAARLAQHSVGAEGNTGMSSPKRYLWDESPRAQQWRFNAWGTGSELEPPVTRGVFIQQINREGTPLCCFDDPGLSPRPKILRTQQPEVAFEAHFTRSSTMMFLLSEIIMHALATINSPAQRGEREQPDVPRPPQADHLHRAERHAHRRTADLPPLGDVGSAHDLGNPRMGAVVYDQTGDAGHPPGLPGQP